MQRTGWWWRSALRAAAAATLGVTVAVAPAIAEDRLSLKGYALGDEMADCPPEADRAEHSGQIMCSMGPTTLANEEAVGHAVVLRGGRVSGVMLNMRSRGPHSNGALREALTAKYGSPNRSRSHLGEYRWTQGTQWLLLDTWKGTVLLIDPAAERAAARERAQSDKEDL